MPRHNRGNGDGRNNGNNNGNNNNGSNGNYKGNKNNNNNNGSDTRGRPHTRSEAKNSQRNDSMNEGCNRKGLSIGTATDNTKMDIDTNPGGQKWNNNKQYRGQDDRRASLRSNQNYQGNQGNQNFQNNWNNNFQNQDNRPPKRGNDGFAMDNYPPKRRAPEPLRTRFTDRDITRTLNEAKRLLREFKAVEARVNTFIPRDNRALWRFMNIQKKGLNAVNMCYYLHHAILDPEGDYDMDNDTAKMCDCNRTDALKIPECYLLAMFYLICSTNYESGLFNFSSPLTGMWPGKKADDLLPDTMMIVPVGEEGNKGTKWGADVKAPEATR
ncbi:hypothetical protein V8F06_002897 [Rhypophila decipiens]